MHTYTLEQCQYSPIIAFFAVPERGKTRTCKALIHVAYRGLRVESLREAFLFRFAKNFQGTVCFDVMDIWKKVARAQSEDIILNRFEKGTRVPRVMHPQRGPFHDTVYYNVFGPTIIATNEPIHKILDTRAVQINMPQAGRHFEHDVTPQAALPLKERLVAFRAKYLGVPLPEVDKPVTGRLGDILKPLWQIVNFIKPERAAHFLSLVRRVEHERRLAKLDSTEGLILQAIVESERKMQKGVLAVKVIADTLNASRTENRRLSPKKVANILKAMGFAKGHTGSGAAAIIWNDQLIDKLLQSYGLEDMPEMDGAPPAEVGRPEVSVELDT